MAAGRTLRSLISRRRRGAEEGEDEDGPVVVEDSQSEGSILSGPDDDEGDGSSLGEPAEAGTRTAQPKAEASPASSRSKKSRKARKRLSKTSREIVAESSESQPGFKAMADTQAMMNGLDISDETAAQETVDFETMDASAAKTADRVITNGHSVNPVERQRRDHEEYKKKRDADPAFIPNRGNFFMHDTRVQSNGQAPLLRGAWAGRGRGRGAVNVGGPFSPANQMATAERAAEQQWKHDLHDTINEDPSAQRSAPRQVESLQIGQSGPANSFPKDSASSNTGFTRPSFSKTTLVGTVQIRVSFPGMKTPVTFSEVPWKHYTRLPDHRPPLRRDKAVMVKLPGHQARTAFPIFERSFIFIARQNRPNQRGMQRGNYQRSIGGYGYSSRRTSMYGGSIYSGSVAASRRSSIVGMRENAFSPVGSFVGAPQNRPVVRLPHGGQPFSGMSTPIGPLSGHQTPTSIPQVHTYPPPQQPTHYGTPTTTVHQPRPQKTISVTGIESPILQQEPQPFRNQLPAHMNEQPPPYFSPPQHPMPLHHTATPLSGIPEQAIHAQSFQPPGGYGQPHFYPAYPPPQGFYYPPPASNGYSQMPMYMMPQPGYVAQSPAHPMPQELPRSVVPPPQPIDATSDAAQQQSQSGMFGHERNGMVYYVPASEAQQSERYQPAESFVPSYAMPGLPPPTPAPESSMPYYYPPPMQPGMQEVGNAVYYPPRPPQ